MPVVVAVVVAMLVVAGCGQGSSRPTLAGTIPAPDERRPCDGHRVHAALHLLDPAHRPEPGRHRRQKAGTLDIYAQPGAPPPARTMTNPFLVNNDPGAPVPLTFLVKDFPVAQHCNWLEVYLPVRPNGSTGWVKATDVSVLPQPLPARGRPRRVHAQGVQGRPPDRLDQDRGGQEQHPHSRRHLLHDRADQDAPNPNGDYGPYAYGLSGYSDTLTSFNGGPGQLGIHGTNEPQYLGTQVSHGCIRMSNANITKLAHELPLGTPVQINT